MKLTHEVLEEAPSFISATDSRILSLRDANLTSLDSIKTLKNTDIHTIIDFSKNNITFINDFPPLLRLRTLILANNNISVISGLQNLIHLESISLAYNKIQSLSDLEHLTALKELHSMYLVGNPVTTQENYRLWCIWRFPNLQVLDFQKIKNSERTEAEKLFADAENKETVQKILSVKSGPNRSHTTDSSEVESNDEAQKNRLTDEDRDRLEKELEEVETLEDIQRIEEILNRGYF